jgi:hypothetical protein
MSSIASIVYCLLSIVDGLISLPKAQSLRGLVLSKTAETVTHRESLLGISFGKHPLLHPYFMRHLEKIGWQAGCLPYSVKKKSDGRQDAYPTVLRKKSDGRQDAYPTVLRLGLTRLGNWCFLDNLFRIWFFRSRLRDRVFFHLNFLHILPETIITT